MQSVTPITKYNCSPEVKVTAPLLSATFGEDTVVAGFLVVVVVVVVVVVILVTVIRLSVERSGLDVQVSEDKVLEVVLNSLSSSANIFSLFSNMASVSLNSF